MNETSHTKDHTKRKTRSVTVTDSEWHLITRKARAASMPISRYVVQCVIGRDAQKEEPVLPAGVARRVARDLLVLARIQELRFAEAGAREDWLKLLEEADAIIEAEKTAG